MAFALENERVDGEIIKAKVDKALLELGIKGYEDRMPYHLSYGEKRKVAFASVMVYNPEILILDEPANNLDPASKRELADFLFAKKETVICASHDLSFLKCFCGKLAVMNSGKIVSCGEISRISSDRKLLFENRLI